ncbi:PaaI family thioesterase [bacterium]|nr:PaaI family thioesterase [candidate division CSSED10-310 bacterium]
MKRMIENTFSRLENYNCFACGPDHPFGLHMEFYFDDDARTITSTIRPGELFDGFPGILHGGIQATILDEVAFWGVWAQHGKCGLTSGLEIVYRKKCPSDQMLEVAGIVGEIERRLVTVDAVLRHHESHTVYTTATVRYFITKS